MIRAGDRVHHIPTDETWLAALDEDQDRVFWCGYPFGGHGDKKDCEVIRKATDTERIDTLNQVSGSRNGIMSGLAQQQLDLTPTPDKQPFMMREERSKRHTEVLGYPLSVRVGKLIHAFSSPEHRASIRQLVKDIREQENCLSEAITLMEYVRFGAYKPDSATTQPWKRALSADNTEPKSKPG